MSGKQGSEEKTLPPSAKKLREARKKGQIARSKEMVTAAVTLTAFSYLYARAGSAFGTLSDALLAAGMAGPRPFTEALPGLTEKIWHEVTWLVTPLLGLIAVAAVLTNVVVNGGVLAAVDPVAPKMERLNPVEGFKRLFAMRSFIELIKVVLKVMVVGTVACVLIAASLQALVEEPSCGLGCTGPVLRGLLRPLLIAVGGFFLVLGALDIGLQRWLFRRDMRMTKTEQKRERKEMEGDPLIKRQHRRERRSTMHEAKTGLRKATFAIRSADIVLALRFAKPDATVPILVARGTGAGAQLLLEEAQRLRLPVVFDSAVTALVAPRLKVGRMISQDMFQAVIACMREAGVL